VVAGSANNILAEPRHGEQLEQRGIVYAVDYIANSGGTIFDTDRLRKGGFDPDRAMANVRRIFERTHEVFDIAAADRVPLYLAADRLAERRLTGLRSLPLLDAPRPRTGPRQDR
ncbi:MAG: leucine dehydrogenase, partial [Gaiellaceae bacterium]